MDDRPTNEQLFKMKKTFPPLYGMTVVMVTSRVLLLHRPFVYPPGRTCYFPLTPQIPPNCAPNRPVWPPVSRLPLAAPSSLSIIKIA